MATAASGTASVGTIRVVTGDVKVIGVDGVARQAMVGDKVFAKETIQTNANAIVQVQLENGRTLDLGRDSKIALDDDVLNVGQAPTTAPATGDIAALQAQIAAGADPSKVAEATAAGGAPGAGGAGDGGGGTAVTLDQANSTGAVTSGFSTSPAGIGFPNLQPGTLPTVLPEVSVQVQVAPAPGSPTTPTLPPGVPQLLAAGNAIVEGTGEGSRVVNFVISLDKPFGSDVTVTYQIVPGTASAGSDYTGALTGTVVIHAGQTSLIVPVSIVQDGAIENNENFSIVLTSATNATISDTAGSAVVVIIDDDLSARADTNWVREDNGHSFTQEGGEGAVTATGNVLQTAAHNGAPDAPQTRGDVSDLDTAIDTTGLSVTPATIVGTYGTLVLSANGSYVYTLNNSNSAVQALDDNEKLTEVFSYTAKNGFGNTSVSSLTITVFGTNDAPIVGAGEARISEEGISRGQEGQQTGFVSPPLPDDNGTPDDQTNDTTYTGTISVSDVDNESLTVTLTEPTTTLTSNGETISWTGAGTGHMVGSIGNGEEGSTPIIDVTINNSGQYTVTLLGPVDHEAPQPTEESPATSVENLLQVAFGVNVFDGTATTATSLTVTIEDDSPAAGVSVKDVTASQVNTNLMIVLDVSTSMNNASGVDNQTRLQLAKAAIDSLMQAYDDLGEVKVHIVTFGIGATAAPTAWMTIEQAHDYLVNVGTSAGTNYDAALDLAGQTNFTQGIPGGQNVSYFLSDGQPNLPNGSVGVSTSEESEWTDFLNTNEVNSFSLGMGTGINGPAETALDSVAYNGTGAGTTADAIIVTDLNELTENLLATVAQVTGNMVTDATTVPAPGAGFGADGGHVQSIEVNGVTYNYTDATGEHESGTYNAGTHMYTITTETGTLLVDMNTGGYTFTVDSTSDAVKELGVDVPFEETFNYTITDNDGDAASSHFTIRVFGSNEPPDARNDAYTTDEETPLVVTVPGVLGNDTDPDVGDTLTVTGHGQAAHGTVDQNPDGSFTYTPAAGYHGTDSFTYTITDGHGGTDTATVNITVNSVNDPPVDGDENVTTPEDTVKTGNVLVGATDPDGDTISVTTFTVTGDGTTYNAGQTANIVGVGTLQISGNGNYTFTPAHDYNGPVPVATYTLSDGHGGTDTSTLTITVTPANDPPVDGDENVTTPEDTVKTGNVLVGATDPEGDTISVTTFTVTGDGTTYNAGQTANIVGVGTLQISGNGNYTFTPAHDYNGPVPVATYTLSDGHGGTDTSTLTITVTPANDPPVDGDENVTTPEDTVKTGNVLVGATDPDGDTISVTTFTVTGDGTTYNAGQTANIVGVGTLQISGNGNYTFTPAHDYNGPVPVATYTLSDGHGGTDTSTLTITVTPANDPPVDGDENVTTPEDTVKTGNVLVGATDPEGDTISVTTFTVTGDGTTYNAGQTANIVGVGTLQIGGNGDYTFTPAHDYNGPVPVATYTLSDGHGGTDTSTLTITVTPVDDAVLIVGSGNGDVGNSPDQHTVNPGPGTSGAINGQADADILVGDPGGSTLQPGQTANIVLVLDRSGSMANNIAFGQTTESRLQAMKDAVNIALDNLYNSGADKVRVHIDQFSTTAGSLGTFDLRGGTPAENAAQLAAAHTAVNALTSTNNTNYEAGLQSALNWMNGGGTTGVLAGANVNKLVFISDGEPNAVLQADGTNPAGSTSSVSSSDAILSILGNYNPSGSNNDDHVNEVTAIESSNANHAAFTIEAVGINVSASALTTLGQVEGTSGSASNITNAADLNTVVGALTGSQVIQTAAGNDSINGGNGNDLIFGDALKTDALADAQGLSTPDGAGWQVFTQLEAHQGTGPGGATWDRAATINYINTHKEELAAESGRTFGNDTIDGGAGNDTIYGQEGNDSIIGGSGNDLIVGGSGNDILTGGADSDTFKFTGSLTAGNADTVKDFTVAPVTSGGDVLNLHDVLPVAAQGQTAEGTLSAFISVATVSGNTVVSVDADGGGAALPVTVVTLEGVTGVTLAQLLANNQIVT